MTFYTQNLYLFTFSLKPFPSINQSKFFSNNSIDLNISSLSLDQRQKKIHKEDVNQLTYLLQNPKPFQIRDYRGHKLDDYLKTIQDKTFTPLQKDALIGTLLGDARLQYCSGRYPHLKFEQGGANIKKGNLTYIQLLYSIFEEFVGTHPKIRLKDGKTHSYFFRTFRCKKFDFYAKQFYTIDHMGKRKKVVPKNIHQWLTPQALAFWFQDHGSKHISGYIFHTENFCLPDIILLQKALGTCFGLESNIHKDNRKSGTLYTIYISASSRDKFTRLVEPYIVDTMKYKLHSLKPVNLITEEKDK